VTAVPGRHALGALARVLPPVMGSVLDYRSSPDSPWLRVYLSGDTLVHDDLREIAVRTTSDEGTPSPSPIREGEVLEPRTGRPAPRELGRTTAGLLSHRGLESRSQHVRPSPGSRRSTT
jgi:hypothetical protein